MCLCSCACLCVSVMLGAGMCRCSGLLRLRRAQKKKKKRLSIKLKGTNSTVIHQQDKIKNSRSIYMDWFASVCWKENGEFTYLFRAYSLWYLLFSADSRVPTQPSSISKTKSKTADLSTLTGLPVFVGKKMVSSHTYLGCILCGTFCFQQTTATSRLHRGSFPFPKEWAY